MSIAEALLLGLVQGVTEFLPISSTAHVTLMGMLLGLEPQAQAQQWTAFLASIQLGSLGALLWYFRRDVGQMLQGLVGNEAGRRLLWLLVVGTLPIVVAGLVLKPFVEGPLTKQPGMIAGALVGVALLMVLAEIAARRQRSLSEISWREALVVGMAQVLALLPGSSRSGSTIAAAMLLGISRPEAARFSFLLSIPALAGSGVLELVELVRHGMVGSGDVLAGSLAAAFLSSYAAIAFLMRYVRTHTLWLFIVYRLLLAVVLVAVTGMFH